MNPSASKSCVVILHPPLNSESTPDVSDVSDQANLVRTALTELGYSVDLQAVRNDFYAQLSQLKQRQPAFVFNLVEELYGKSELLPVVPACMAALKLPFSGASAETLTLTTNKITAKRLLKIAGIATPAWIDQYSTEQINQDGDYLIKPVSEEGSVCLDEYSVCRGDELNHRISALKNSSVSFFAEEFLKGREFNVSILGTPGNYVTFPVAEMIFSNYPDNKAKILGYKAKWNQDSFEYLHTSRQFNTLTDSPGLNAQLHQIATRCGKVFHIEGYFRVDFRLDEKGNPHVLEINANPCIAPDSGFIAAAAMAGITPRELVRHIIHASPFISEGECKSGIAK